MEFFPFSSIFQVLKLSIPYVIAVLYENETHDDTIKDDKMRIIEMEKPRPQVFSSNLLQKTIVSHEKSSSTTVKPSGLG